MKQQQQFGLVGGEPVIEQQLARCWSDSSIAHASGVLDACQANAPNVAISSDWVMAIEC